MAEKLATGKTKDRFLLFLLTQDSFGVPDLNRSMKYISIIMLAKFCRMTIVPELTNFVLNAVTSKSQNKNKEIKIIDVSHQ